MQLSFDNRTYLVTGGGSGIGKAVAAGLVGAGAAVMIVGRSADRLASAVNEGSDIGIPSCFATAVAVGGINCISPRAPDGLTAATSKLLSCRMIPSENAGSGGPAGWYGTGQPS